MMKGTYLTREINSWKKLVRELIAIKTLFIVIIVDEVASCYTGRMLYAVRRMSLKKKKRKTIKMRTQITK